MTATTGTVSFFVPGVPRPKGSKRHVGHGRMIESSKGLPAWRSAVETAARATGTTFTGPVAVEATFVMPRTQRMGRDASLMHTVAPDGDKLGRAVGDALTDSGIITDDSVIVRWVITKRRAGSLEARGAHITIRPFTDAELLGEDDDDQEVAA